MRFTWCLLWLAVLIAIVLSIPLIDRSVIDIDRHSGGQRHEQGQDSPLLPVPLP